MIFDERLECFKGHARIALDWSTAVREDIWPHYQRFIEKLIANHVATLRRGQASGEVDADVDVETSALMLISTAQMTAQLKLAGIDAEKIERMSSLMFDAALGRSNA